MNHREWGLRHFLIPRIIGVIWWIAVLAVFGVILEIISQYLIPWYLGRSMENVTVREIMKNLWMPLATLLVIRVFLESLSVVFSIHDRLAEILAELRESRDQFRKLNLGVSASNHPTKTKPQLFS